MNNTMVLSYRPESRLSLGLNYEILPIHLECELLRVVRHQSSHCSVKGIQELFLIENNKAEVPSKVLQDESFICIYAIGLKIKLLLFLYPYLYEILVFFDKLL
jgi:hypothetical protein